MVVLNETGFLILHILGGEISNDANLYQLPMCLQNVVSLRVLEDEQAEQIDQGNLVLVFSNLCQLS